MRVVLGLCAAALLTLPACVLDFDGFSFNMSDYRYKFEDRYDKDLDAAVEQVALTIVNGSITIETWDMDRIEIAIHERIKAEDEAEAEVLAEAVTMVGTVSGSTLDIDLDYGDMYNRRRNYACNLEVKLPKRLKLKLATTNGGIDIEAMDSAVTATTTNGSIHLDGCGGDVELVSTNGEIVARAVRGAIKAETTNGGIDIESLGGPVHAETTNGGIDAVITEALQGDVSLESTNGNIRLSINPASHFRIDAGTSNGGIDDNLPGSDFDYNRRRTSMRGSYGNGTHSIYLSTTNGGIDLLRN